MSDKSVKDMTDEEFEEWAGKPCSECGQRPNEVRCSHCGSCGENGCCHPGRCELFYCTYGKYIVNSYEADEKRASEWYSVLHQLGVYDIFAVTEEHAKQVGDAKLGDKTLRQIIDSLLRPVLPEWSYEDDCKIYPYQVIDTAPKDGTHILLYRKVDGWQEGHYGEIIGMNKRWIIGGIIAESEWAQPTHWMPLPMTPEDDHES